jgi:hypothetical protein
MASLRLHAPLRQHPSRSAVLGPVRLHCTEGYNTPGGATFTRPLSNRRNRCWLEHLGTGGIVLASCILLYFTRSSVHYKWCLEERLPELWAISDKQKKKWYFVQREGEETGAVRLSELEEYNPKGARFVDGEHQAIRGIWHQYWRVSVTRPFLKPPLSSCAKSSPAR